MAWTLEAMLAFRINLGMGCKGLTAMVTVHIGKSSGKFHNIFRCCLLELYNLYCKGKR
jgi:hypothetical protein